jgi:hypothetical protein
VAVTSTRSPAPELGDQRPPVALGHQPAFVDDPDAVAEALGLLHVVGRVEHRQALVAERLDAAQDGVAALGVDPHRRLVEHQQPGPVQQPGGDVGPPLHAPGVRADPVAAPVGQPHQLEHLAHPPGHLPAGQALEPAEEPQVLLGRQVLVEGDLLGHQADGGLGRGRARPHRPPGHGHRAGVPGEQAAGHGDRGGLAGAVGPQQAVGLADVDVEAHVIDRDAVAEGLAEPRAHEHRLGHGSTLSVRGAR